MIPLDFTLAQAVSLKTSHRLMCLAVQGRNLLVLTSMPQGLGFQQEMGGNEGSSMTVATRTGISDNAAAAISYFTFIPAIVFLLLPPYKESSYVRFHAWQSVLLSIVAFVIDIILGSIALLTLFLGTSALAYTFRTISLLWLVVWLVCVVRAVNGKRFMIPLLGSIAEKLAMK
jgi:uncharacterized membrane protein